MRGDGRRPQASGAGPRPPHRPSRATVGANSRGVLAAEPRAPGVKGIDLEPERQVTGAQVWRHHLVPGPCLSPRGPRGHLEGRLPLILNGQTLKRKILFVYGTQRPHKPPCRERGIVYLIPNPKHVVRLFLKISSSSGRQTKRIDLFFINNPSAPRNRGQLVPCGLPGVPEPPESVLVTQTPSPACKAASGPASTADFNRCRLSRMSFHEGQTFPKNPPPSVEKGTCV